MDIDRFCYFTSCGRLATRRKETENERVCTLKVHVTAAAETVPDERQRQTYPILLRREATGIVKALRLVTTSRAKNGARAMY
jgi:hypothetical protein